MVDIAMQVEVAAPPREVHRALTTTDGIAGWWTAKNETSGTVGEVDRFYFPGMPMSWDMRVRESRPGELVAWHCEGGLPDWVGTDIRWTLAPADGGTLVVFDHTGFAEINGMFRIVTVGWAQMLERLQQYLASGKPVPFFDHAAVGGR
jgi:uncharacterized protein YndB with AHSA1/START domain